MERPYSINQRPLRNTKMPVRISFSVGNIKQGQDVLAHLTEDRLVAGGTIIHAAALNWVGGKLTEKDKREVTAYTTYDNLPLVRSRIEIFFAEEGEIPTISQFVMTNEKKSTLDWIERNVR